MVSWKPGRKGVKNEGAIMLNAAMNSRKMINIGCCTTKVTGDLNKKNIRNKMEVYHD